MKAIVRVTVLLGILWPSASPSLVNAHTAARVDRTIESKIGAYLKPYLDLNGFSGAILIAKGGRPVFSKGYGMANYELNAAEPV